MSTLPTTGPESICVSLEKARALKESGWPQGDSVLCIYETPEGATVGWGNATKAATYGGEPVPTFAAPTAEEILRRLPTRIKRLVERHEYFLKITPYRAGGGLPSVYFVGYETIPTEDGESVVHMMDFEPRDESLANAAAAMWIYLSTHNLLKP